MPWFAVSHQSYVSRGFTLQNGRHHDMIAGVKWCQPASGRRLTLQSWFVQDGRLVTLLAKLFFEVISNPSVLAAKAFVHLPQTIRVTETPDLQWWTWNQHTNRFFPVHVKNVKWMTAQPLQDFLSMPFCTSTLHHCWQTQSGGAHSQRNPKHVVDHVQSIQHKFKFECVPCEDSLSRAFAFLHTSQFGLWVCARSWCHWAGSRQFGPRGGLADRHETVATCESFLIIITYCSWIQSWKRFDPLPHSLMKPLTSKGGRESCCS